MALSSSATTDASAAPGSPASQQVTNHAKTDANTVDVEAKTKL